MKLLHRYIDYKHGNGRMTFIPEEGEDLWHVYNLIAAGDVVRCTTLRKVVTESSTGFIFVITIYIVSFIFSNICIVLTDFTLPFLLGRFTKSNYCYLWLICCF